MTFENTNSSDNKLIGDIPLPSKMHELVNKNVELRIRSEIKESRLEIRKAFKDWEKSDCSVNKIWLRNVPPTVVQIELKEMGYIISTKHSNFLITW